MLSPKNHTNQTLGLAHDIYKSLKGVVHVYDKYNITHDRKKL